MNVASSVQFKVNLLEVQFGELTPSTSATKASYGSSHGLLDITGTNSGRLCFFESHFPSKGQCYLVSNLISSSFWRVDGAFSGSAGLVAQELLYINY